MEGSLYRIRMSEETEVVDDACVCVVVEAKSKPVSTTRSQADVDDAKSSPMWATLSQTRC